MRSGRRVEHNPVRPPVQRDLGGQARVGNQLALIRRARGLDLGGAYQIPPGDPVSHFGAGFATVLAANHFIAGFDADFVAEHLGYFTAPLADRRHVMRYQVDDRARSVSVLLDNGVTRTARICGDQGAVAIPLGADDVGFSPVAVPKRPQPQDPEAWPDGVVDGSSSAQVDDAALQTALDVAFADGTMTAAVVVTHRGRVVAERYAPGVGLHTPLEGWSMGKSLTGILLGMLIHQGEYELNQPAPVPQWQNAGDPRAAITVAHLLQMASGLRFRAMQDPDYQPSLGYPDHLYVYNGGVDAFEFAASRPLQYPPGAVGRYRNVDPVLANHLVRLAVERRSEEYLTWPQRALFDRLGIVDMTLETDPFGNFLLQGYEFGTARDWAKLGNLYLQDGVWLGERLLPEGWSTVAATPAPGWVADGRPIYGGSLCWINADGELPVPTDAYFMAGAGGQRTIIVPSHDLVIVRLGHYSGTPRPEAFGAIVAAVGAR